MAGRTHARGQFRRALVPLVALAALALAGCKDAPEDGLTTTAAGAATPDDQAGSSQGAARAPSADKGDKGDKSDNGDKGDPGAGSSSDDPGSDGSSEGDSGQPTGESTDGSGDPDAEGFVVDPPGPFVGLHRSDVLITATESLPDRVVRRIRHVPGVETALPISVGSASINGRTLTVAAVDPGRFRAFTPDVTARADFVWERVAGGELAVDNDVDKRLINKHNMMQLGSDEDSPVVHIGAFAPLITASPNTPSEKPVIQVVMNDKRGAQLGIQEQNALIVDTGLITPSKLKGRFQKILGDRATMNTLAIEFGNLGQSAVLTGESVSDAVGTFTYTSNPDGTINPDPAWIKAYVRTEEVPILGRVTCNKGMLPQMRAALEEIQLAGLADKIHPDEYAGCYYPRYIGRSAANGLSLHSWGIAFDINVPGNLRGTKGEIDRRVVAIFKKWGFAWGGDWNYTDPMHFEMSKVVRPE